MNKRQNPYSEVLLEIERGLWEHDIFVDEGKALPYEYDNDTFRACLKIFMSALLWKIWRFTSMDNISLRESNAEKAGKVMRNIILKFTGIDSHTLYK